MDFMVVLSLMIFAVVIITVMKGVRIVPQGEEWVVERLGKYNDTLKAGLSIIIPYLDSVRYKVPTKDLILDIPQQEVITADNAVILVNAIAFVKVTDPVKAVYGVESFRMAIQNLTMTTLRSIIGQMQLDQALSSREVIKARLKDGISDEAIDWGITIKSVEIQDIKPSPSMQKAMEQQASAERERRAMIARAEGEKQSAILEAEGKLAAAKLAAEAQVKLAEASAEAIKKITETVGEKELPTFFLLGDRYITALDKLAGSQNSKVVLLPADLQETIRGLVGSSAKR